MKFDVIVHTTLAGATQLEHHRTRKRAGEIFRENSPNVSRDVVVTFKPAHVPAPMLVNSIVASCNGKPLGEVFSLRQQQILETQILGAWSIALSELQRRVTLADVVERAGQGYAAIFDDVTLEAALKLAHGSYQRAILAGVEALSGATLTGEAKRYSGHYARSARNFVDRCKAAGLAMDEVRGPHGKRILVVGAVVL